LWAAYILIFWLKHFPFRPPSYPERILNGAEAIVFAEALLVLLDEAILGQFDDYQLDVDCFDNPQRTLHVRYEVVLLGTPWNKRLDWSENGGSRAEVRRERKKRDTLSPANVL
jgi:hypothetical protein